MGVSCEEDNTLIRELGKLPVLKKESSGLIKRFVYNNKVRIFKIYKLDLSN